MRPGRGLSSVEREVTLQEQYSSVHQEARKAAGSPIRRTAALSLRDQAYAAIKHRILTCVFQPGDYVTGGQLAEVTGFGRTPVHQAIDRLQTDGLVEVIPRKGIVVRPVTLDDMIHLVPVRLANESLCARLAAERAGAADVAAMSDVLERAKQATAKGNTEQLVLLDRDFHACLARASRNPVLEDLLGKLHERSLRYWFISLTAQSQRRAVQREHADILEAVRRRDADAAETAARTHLESFHASVRSLI